MKNKIILCVGIQASGKSTFSKAWVAEEPEKRVRFNNDDIRNALGVYWVPSREKLISSIKDDFAKNAIKYKYDIIVDNMNLNPKEDAYWQKIADDNDYDIERKYFLTPLKECIRRDSLRENPIGAKIIRATYAHYHKFLESKRFQEINERFNTRDDSKPSCIIVDLDGTTSLNTEGRMYCGGNCYQDMLKDTPLKSIIELVNKYDDTDVVIVTGRTGDENTVSNTLEWLRNNDVLFDKIYFRPERSNIKASDYKEGILKKDILPKYNVLFSLEDNDDCVEMYKRNNVLTLKISY